MLTLPIKKKWFDMILSGEKKEEYRDLTPYYKSRLSEGEKRTIVLRNGYRLDSPTIVCYCSVSIGTGKTDWGAEPDKNYFVLKVEKVVKCH